MYEVQQYIQAAKFLFLVHIRKCLQTFFTLALMGNISTTTTMVIPTHANTDTALTLKLRYIECTLNDPQVFIYLSLHTALSRIIG